MTRQATKKKSKWPWSVYIFIWTIHLSSFFRNGGWCGATGRVAVVVGPKPWLRMCKSLRRPKTIFVSRGPSSRRPKQLEVGFFFFFGLANLAHWTAPGNPIQSNLRPPKIDAWDWLPGQTASEGPTQTGIVAYSSQRPHQGQCD